MVTTADQLVKPSDLRDIPVGAVQVWWTWLLGAIGLGLFYMTIINEWNFPWLPLGGALFLFGYGALKTFDYRNATIQHYDYMIKYGLKREATMFKCNLCGAIFNQPEGADLCPECYESGIVEVEA
tara:strand:- start:63 stop:437 length:375 start_codon:yes stop_codon:yes gene_type:complete